jgi:outer membrane murein-binding lipoprotein Lpp
MDNNPVQPTSSQPLQTPVPAPGSPVNAKHAHRFIFAYFALIILVAVAGGVYAWQHKKVNDSNTRIASLQSQLSGLQSQVNKLSKQAQASQASSSSSSVKYLDIPEEGIKFQLSSAISDAYYVKNSNGYIYLSVHSFDDNAELAGCTASSTGTGNLGVVVLIVAKPGEPNGDFAGDDWTLDSIKQAGLAQVGDSYYGFQKGNGACWDVNAPDAASEASQYGAVEQAFIAAEPTITKL